MSDYQLILHPGKAALSLCISWNVTLEQPPEEECRELRGACCQLPHSLICHCRAAVEDKQGELQAPHYQLPHSLCVSLFYYSEQHGGTLTKREGCRAH